MYSSLNQQQINRDNKQISKSSVFKLNQQQINRDNKQISKSSVFKLNQQQINRDNKWISKSSVFKLNQQQITETKLISKQYPSHKEISGTSTKPTLTQVKDKIYSKS